MSNKNASESEFRGFVFMPDHRGNYYKLDLDQRREFDRILKSCIKSNDLTAFDQRYGSLLIPKAPQKP